MSDKRPVDASLPQVQRWMQSVLMHRGGVAEGVDAAETRQHIDITLAELPRVILPSQSLSSADRLEIYVNAYHARLMECLDEEFAVTRWAMGEELFAAVTFGYLQAHPSQSYTLNQLGARFPGYLAASRLHAREMPPEASDTWPDFIVELATLERILYEVYDGPGIERTGILDAEALSRLRPEDWGRLRLIPAPCLRLLRFGHDVSQFWSDHKDGLEPKWPMPAETCMAVHRRDYVVERRRLTAAQYALLEPLCRGLVLPEAILAARDESGVEATAVDAGLADWFREWTSAGWFVAFELAAT